MVKGDKTTCGGVIIEGDTTHTLLGKPVARERDKVTCGQHPGTYYIAGGIANDVVHGRKMAGTLDSQSTCPCKAKFIPSMTDDTYEKVSASQGGAEQYAQSANKNNRVLKNQYGDPIRDENGHLVYEMPESRRPDKNEMNNILQAQRDALIKRKYELEHWSELNEERRSRFKKAFGSDDDFSRNKILMAKNK
ncbi:PAAR domain-containing protein [Cronobacter malonaticus]|nr:PAAR domain-containing protein [Cronobacter malonaticus]